jgi:uncharacterized membrane protein YfcA
VNTELFLICLVSFFASALTLISGFGSGTILLPVFALFFPLDIAIGLTAIVHLLNNLFKLVLLGKHAHIPTLFRFGIPSVIAAFAGAWALLKLTGMPALFIYHLSNHIYSIYPVNLIIGLLLLLFSLFEILPAFKNLQFDRRHLFIGGLLSGFFGGLSGHQGALRSAFLIKAGLTREQFLATGIAIACFIDLARLTVYSGHVKAAMQQEYALLIAAVLSAFAGVFIISRLLHKITITMIQKTVAVMLIIFSVMIGAGII